MKIYYRWVQHVANPLHIYCRLIDFGVSQGFSRRLGVAYERYFFPLIYKDVKHVWNFLRKRYL